MNRGRKIQVSCVGIAMLCLTLTACQKEPYINKVVQTPYLGMPSDIHHLHRISVKGLRGRAWFETMRAWIQGDSTYGRILNNMNARTGLNPFPDIDTIAIAVRGNAAEPFLAPVGMIMQGRFRQPEQFLRLLHEWMGEEFLIAPSFEESVHVGSGYTMYRMRAQSQYNERIVFDLNFAFPAESLLCLCFSPGLLSDMLNVMAGEQVSLGQDEFWQGMLKRPDIAATIWGTGEFPEKLVQARDWGGLPIEGQQFDHVIQYYFDIDLIDEIQFNFGLTCESIDEAGQLSGQLKDGLDGLRRAAQQAGLQEKLPQTARLLDRVRVFTELQTSRMTFRLSPTQQDDLVEEWEELRRAPDGMSQIMDSLPLGSGTGIP